jgi:hypothetical protein
MSNVYLILLLLSIVYMFGYMPICIAGCLYSTNNKLCDCNGTGISGGIYRQTDGLDCSYITQNNVY